MHRAARNHRSTRYYGRIACNVTCLRCVMAILTGGRGRRRGRERWYISISNLSKEMISSSYHTTLNVTSPILRLSSYITHRYIALYPAFPTPPCHPTYLLTPPGLVSASCFPRVARDAPDSAALSTSTPTPERSLSSKVMFSII